MQIGGDTGDISLLFFLAGANFGPFWVIFGPLWTILGHFLAILGHFSANFCANFVWPKM